MDPAEQHEDTSEDEQETGALSREEAQWRLVIWRDFFGYSVTVTAEAAEVSDDTSDDSGDGSDSDDDDEDPWRAALDRVPQNPQDGDDFGPRGYATVGDHVGIYLPNRGLPLPTGGLPPNVGEAATGGLPPNGGAAGSGGLPLIVEGPPTGGLPPSMGGSPPSPLDQDGSDSSSGSTLDSDLASSLTEDIANGVWERGAGLPRQPACWGFPMPDFTLMLDDGDTSVLSQPSALRPPSTASSPPLSAEA